GLSSLEAGACGCNLVISKFGDSSDYFKDFTEYCDPGSVDSIKFAILNAFQRPFDETLSNFILKNYTWQEAAKKTLKVYEGILA
ncbi:MAG: hypothetical protein MRY83_06275, partial [Flavobacteriales bacterium]|nr:hypothetical protein [Flavobacteriales bacterium]